MFRIFVIIRLRKLTDDIGNIQLTSVLLVIFKTFEMGGIKLTQKPKEKLD